MLRSILKSSAASRARIKPSLKVRVLSLEDRFLAVLVASGTKHMRRFSRCEIRLQGIGEDATGNFRKRITLALAVPVLKLRNRCFQFTYAIGELRVLILHLKHRALGVDDGVGDFCAMRCKRSLIAKSYCALDDVFQRFQRRHSTRDGTHVGHLKSLPRKAVWAYRLLKESFAPEPAPQPGAERERRL